MADPDYEWIEGFERWGSAGSDSADWGYAGYMDDGEYTSISINGAELVAGLVPSAGGQALQASLGSITTLSKTLPANYARVIGGCTLYTLLGTQQSNTFVSFNDGGTNQIAIGYNTSGNLWVSRNGTAIATSTEVMSYGSTNVIEWDVTFHNTTGIAKVWLNGVPTSIDFTGDTCGSANNYANSFSLIVRSSNIMDHVYLWFYTAAGGSETPALTNPVVETTTVDETVAADFILGEGTTTGNELIGGGINRDGRMTYYRPFIAPAGGNISKIYVYCFQTNATTAVKVSLYADNGSGRPGARLCAPVEITGIVASTVLTFNVAATAVVKGTRYYLALSHSNGAGSSPLGSYTNDLEGWVTNEGSYAAAMPASAGSASAVAPPWLWSNLTDVAEADFYSQLAFPHPGPYNYLAAATADARDQYGFAPLSVDPTVIYSVSVSYAVSKSDAGVKTIDLEVDSGGVKYTGTNGAAKTPPQNLTWYTSYYRRNPNGGAAWSKTSVDAMNAGYKIVG